MSNEEMNSAINALVSAFKQGVSNFFETRGDNRLVPTDEELRDAARCVLAQEANDCKIRELARKNLIEIDLYMHRGVESKGFPPASECPVFLSKYSWTGGSRYLDDTDMSLEECLRHSMESTYDEWFRQRVDGPFKQPRRHEEIKITTCLEEGGLLVETMKWDGTLVSERVEPKRK